jgi:hypothetical protein
MLAFGEDVDGVTDRQIGRQGVDLLDSAPWRP